MQVSKLALHPAKSMLQDDEEKLAKQVKRERENAFLRGILHSKVMQQAKLQKGRPAVLQFLRERVQNAGENRSVFEKKVCKNELFSMFCRKSLWELLEELKCNEGISQIAD